MSSFQVIRGDDLIFNISAKDSAGAAIDSTGTTIFFTAKKDLGRPDSEAVLAKSVSSHINATSGISKLAFTAAETDSLVSGKYYFDFQFKKTTGEIVSSEKGTFDVVYDVTRRTT